MGKKDWKEVSVPEFWDSDMQRAYKPDQIVYTIPGPNYSAGFEVAKEKPYTEAVKLIDFILAAEMSGYIIGEGGGEEI